MSAAIRLALFGIFLAPVLSAPAALVFVLMLVPFTIFPERRLDFLRFSPFLFSPALSAAYVLFGREPAASLPAAIFWGALAGALAFAACAALLYLAWRVAYPMIFLLGTFAAFALGDRVLTASTPLFHPFARNFQCAFWGLAYFSVLPAADRSWRAAARAVPFAAPFWAAFFPITPLFRTERDYRDQACHAGDEADCQWSGLKLAAVCAFLFFARFLIFRVFVRGELTPFAREYFFGWKGPAREDLLRLCVAHLPGWALRFTFGPLSLALHVLDFSVYLGAVVAVARMAGFRAFRVTYRPYAAASFVDYLRRFHFYWNMLVIEIFYRQWVKWAARVALPVGAEARRRLGWFGGIFTAWTAFEFTLSVFVSPVRSPADIFLSAVSALSLYALLFAALAWGSFFLDPYWPSFVPRWLRVVCYFFAQGIVLYSAVGPAG